jgi:hypothetical protein
MDALVPSPPSPPPRCCVRFFAKPADQRLAIDARPGLSEAFRLLKSDHEARSGGHSEGRARAPDGGRAAVAGSQLESFDTGVDEDAEGAWVTEVNRRLAELENGAAKTIPWPEVRRRLAEP